MSASFDFHLTRTNGDLLDRATNESVARHRAAVLSNTQAGSFADARARTVLVRYAPEGTLVAKYRNGRELQPA